MSSIREVLGKVDKELENSGEAGSPESLARYVEMIDEDVDLFEAIEISEECAVPFGIMADAGAISATDASGSAFMQGFLTALAWRNAQGSEMPSDGL